MTDNTSEADGPDRRHWSGWKLEERRVEAEPALGGTLEAPAHESPDPTTTRRWQAVLMALGCAVLIGACLGIAFWGWRPELGYLMCLTLAPLLAFGFPWLTGEEPEVWAARHKTGLIACGATSIVAGWAIFLSGGNGSVVAILALAGFLLWSPLLISPDEDSDES